MNSSIALLTLRSGNQTRLSAEKLKNSANSTASPRRHRRPHRHDRKTQDGADEDEQSVKQDDRGRLIRHRTVGDLRQMAGALAHEDDLGGAEIEQPQRHAEGADQDEDREVLRREHAREHESLNQPATTAKPAVEARSSR